MSTQNRARTLLPHYRRLLENAQKWDEIIAERDDNWQNALTGTGTSRDKLSSNDFQAASPLSFGILEALYHEDDMAARICDEIPDQALRAGFTPIIPGDTETPQLIQEECSRLGVVGAMTEAWTWGRLYGGGAVFVGADDGIDVSLPLREDLIRTIRHLTVFDRWYMLPNTWYQDPNSPKYGEVETFRILRQTNGPLLVQESFIVVHESRLIMFGGARTSYRRKRANYGWDDSVLQKVYSPLQMFSMNWASVAQLMSDASQGVYKIKGLADMITGGAKDALMTRMATVDQSRSSGRMVLVDAEEEDFTRVATPFGGIPEVLDRSAQRLAAAAGMPLTVLMGMSPAGMNATGESDIRGWYDKIAKIRELELRPKLERLIDLLLLAKDSPTGGVLPDDISLDFPPLWQPSALETAQTRAAVATADVAYIGAQVFLPEEIAISRATPDGYSSEYGGVNIDARADLLQQDALAEKLAEPVEDPAAPVEDPADDPNTNDPSVQ